MTVDMGNCRRCSDVDVAVAWLWDTFDRPPSLREIARFAGIASTSTVAYHVRHLVARGVLRAEAGEHRTIRRLQ